MGNTILVILTILILGVSVLWAFLRGLKKARIRGITVIASLLLAIIATLITRGLMVSNNAFVVDFLAPWLSTYIGEYTEILEISETLNEVVLHFFASLAMPIIFLLFFIVFSFLSWIAFLVITIVKGRTLSDQSSIANLRFLRAMAWGLAQGIVILFVVMLPIGVYLDVAPTVIDAIVESEIMEDEMANELREIEKDYAESANKGILAMHRALGGKACGDLITDFKIEDNHIDFSEEIASISDFGCNIVHLTQVKLENYGSSESYVFLAIADSFEDSVLLPTIAGEVIERATDKWLAGETFMGLEKPDFGEMTGIFEPFFDRLLIVLNADSREYTVLQGDFNTVAEMVAVFAEDGIFAKMSDTEKLMSALGGNGVIGEVIEILGANDTMKVLIPELTNVGLRAIATTLNIPENMEEVYGTLMQDIADAVNYASHLSEAQRVEQLTADLEDAFNEAGVPIDEEILDCYSVSMIEDLIHSADGKEITSEDVEAFFAVYAMNSESAGTAADDSSSANETVSLSGKVTLPMSGSDRFAGTVYANKSEEELMQSGAAALFRVYSSLAQLETQDKDALATQAKQIICDTYAALIGEEAEGMKRLEQLQVSKQISNDSQKTVASLQSAEQMKENGSSVKTTLKDLLIDTADAAQSINSETIATESEAIESIFDAASKLSVQMSHNSNLDITTVGDMLGGILDSLSETETFGSDKTATLFTAVLQSETVRGAADIDMQTATQMAQKATDGNVNYTQTMNAVSGGVNVFTKLGKDGEEVSEEELVSLIRNINPQTAGMLEVFVTPARLESYKVSANCSDTAAELITSIFHYMGSDNDMSDEQYEKEAKALNQVLDIALSAKEHSSEKHLFTQGGHSGILPNDAATTVEIFMSSKSISYSLRSTMLENGEVKEGKFDAFEVGAKIPEHSTDREDCVNAIDAYYSEHPDAETRDTLLAFSALLGVDAATVLN